MKHSDENFDLQQIQIHIRAMYPCIHVKTFEETRFLKNFRQFQEELAEKSDYSYDIYEWSCTKGWMLNDEEVDSNCKNPQQALEYILKGNDSDDFIYVLKDFHHFLNNDPYIIRLLRDTIHYLDSCSKSIILLSPTLKIPIDLEKDIIILDYKLPEYNEIERNLDQLISSLKTRTDKKIQIKLSDNERADIIKSALGLTLLEAEAALCKATIENQSISKDIIPSILKSKSQILKKSDILDIYPVDNNFRHIGGLENLKKWFNNRKQHFTTDAKDYGLPYPKGIMLVGVPGCGKSLCAKAIGALWQLPVLKFDVGKVFSGLVGASEENIRNVIKVAESLAPCILFIDEIEKGFSGLHSSSFSDSGTTARTFGTFLQWLQDKEKPVFVLGTANMINLLPPEFLRKGRFDELFYVDLPTSAERYDIFKIHLEKRAANRKNDIEFAETKIDDLITEDLINQSDGFSGAEIEQIVIDSLNIAFINGMRPLKASDLKEAMKGSVPLSETMKEQIQALREWASTRAKMASNCKLESKKDKDKKNKWDRMDLTLRNYKLTKPKDP